MSHKRPFFSVVIPTRSRAQLLRYALRSALNQTFDDYEIVVSDNFSQDNTSDIVRELTTPKVKYVKADRPLTMPENWEFALGHAQGEYITYLCDDDALRPDALKIVADTIAQYGSSLLVLGSAVYYADNWLDAALRNSVAIPTYTGSIRECDSRDTLTHLFRCWDTFHAPRMQNSFCRRDMVFQVHAESRGIFFLIPDYSFAACILTAVPRWTYIDEPLRLQGVFAEGIGSTTLYNRGEPAQEFIREFGRTKLFERVPLSAPTTTNYIAETLLMAKEKLTSKLGDFEIDWEQYFIASWHRIWLHEMAGVSVEADKEEFFHVLAQQPKELQFSVHVAIKRVDGSHPLKIAARKIINSSPLLMRLESVLRGRQTQSIFIQGKEAGFGDILECAGQLQSLAGG